VETGPSPTRVRATGLRRFRSFPDRLRNEGVRPKRTFRVGPMNGRDARESVFASRPCSMVPGYGAGDQVLGLRTAPTTSRIAAITSSGWSWWMLCPLLVAMA
jgi:hypothetical protein